MQKADPDPPLPGSKAKAVAVLPLVMISFGKSSLGAAGNRHHREESE